MKKTVLLTVFILSLVFSVTSYAAVTETAGYMFIEPAAYIGPLTIGSDTFPAGTLPISTGETKDKMTGSSANGWYNRGTRFLTETTGTDSSATAVYENGEGSDAVFKLTGSAVLMDRLAIAAKNTGVKDSALLPAPIRRYSARIKLSTVSAGITGIHVIENSDTASALNDSGVYLSNGGAYVNNAVSGEEVWFVPTGTMTADTWYTVETVVEILADGHVTQDARIYTADGSLVGSSGFVYVEEDTTVTKTSTMSQIYTKDFGTDYAMVKEWKGWSSTSAPTKATFTTDGSDVDEITDNRKVYKLISDTALDAASVNNDTVKLTMKDADTYVDVTGGYTVTYDSAVQAIVVTATNALPYGTEFAIELDTGKMIANSDKYLAVDYTNASTLKYTFTTLSDPFAVTSIGYTPGTGASVTVSNSDSAGRSCIVIVSLFGADEEYLETKCERADIAASPDGQPVNVTIDVPKFDNEVSGGNVQIMVWDKWDSMNWFEDLYTLPI